MFYFHSPKEQFYLPFQVILNDPFLRSICPLLLDV